MDKNALILLVEESPAGGESLRQALGDGGGGFRVQSVGLVATALARIGGGGVDLVVLDLSRSEVPEIHRLDSFLELRSKAPQVPIVVVYGSDEDSLVMRAVKKGGADYLPRGRCDNDLNPLIRSAIGRRLAQLDAGPRLVIESRTGGKRIAFLGAKGGVGTTTVALGTASALAQRGKVILTELRPWFGTLSTYFHPHAGVGSIAQVLRADAGTVARAQAEACLWSHKKISGLSILFGPQSLEQCGEVAAHRVKDILKDLSMLADYVVIDLPASVSEANRAAIAESDSLVLVVERDPLCIETAQQILETIRAWNAAELLAGSVIVNRAPLAAPMDLSEIERLLAIPTLAVIPPAADLCISAEKAGAPLPLFDPESIAAQSMIGLAEEMSSPLWKRARAS